MKFFSKMVFSTDSTLCNINIYKKNFSIFRGKDCLTLNESHRSPSTQHIIIWF